MHFFNYRRSGSEGVRPGGLAGVAEPAESGFRGGRQPTVPLSAQKEFLRGGIQPTGPLSVQKEFLRGSQVAQPPGRVVLPGTVPYPTYRTGTYRDVGRVANCDFLLGQLGTMHYCSMVVLPMVLS
jgi:hypothetical protein